MNDHDHDDVNDLLHYGYENDYDHGYDHDYGYAHGYDYARVRVHDPMQISNY